MTTSGKRSEREGAYTCMTISEAPPRVRRVVNEITTMPRFDLVKVQVDPDPVFEDEVEGDLGLTLALIGDAGISEEGLEEIVPAGVEVVDARSKRRGLAYVMLRFEDGDDDE